MTKKGGLVLKIAVVPNLTRDRALPVTENVCRQLIKSGVSFAFDSSLKDALSGVEGAKFADEAMLFGECDLVIAVGGDGSVMRAAKVAAKYGKNVLGIKAGRLAYLCGLDAEETELLSRLVTGEYSVCRRMMLRAELIRNGAVEYSEGCLNDIVFGRSAAIAMCRVNVNVNGKPTAEYIADGVIVATPTGSTAYSMSAGGPILEPTLDAVLLTPICPHSLVSRPYIFSSETVFDITCTPMRSGDETGFSCDGGATVKLREGDSVRVSKSELYANLISVKQDNFIDVLNGKSELKK